MSDTKKVKTTRHIVGERYTQVALRVRELDKANALANSNNDYESLMFLHSLGYDVSQARIVRY